MSARRFGAIELLATTNTVLMDSATNFSATVNIRFVNRNATSVLVRLALVDAPSGTAIANLANEDYLEYDTTIPANGVLENTGIAVEEGHSLVIYSDTTNVNVVSYGFEEQNI